MLFEGGRLGLRRAMDVLRIDDDAGGTVVERLYHFGTCQRL